MSPSPSDVSAFAAGVLSGRIEIAPLQKDLSRRTYYRLSSEGGSGVVLCVHADAADPSIEDFVSIGAFLERAGIPVPKVLRVDREKGWVLQSDAGTADLSGAGDPARLPDLYTRLIELIVQMQSAPAEPPVNGRAFDDTKLKQEMNFFRSRLDETAPKLGIPSLPFEFSMFLDSVCEKLGAIGGFVFVHRDLHSKNVMVSGDSVTLIDFQDARMGLPWYDVASLLYDPYLEIGSGERERLLRLYVQRSAKSQGRNVFYLQALQRTVKAMGTYLSVLGQTRSSFYLKALKTALTYLEEIVQLGGFPDHGFVFAIEARAALEKVHW